MSLLTVILTGADLRQKDPTSAGNATQLAEMSVISISRFTRMQQKFTGIMQARYLQGRLFSILRKSATNATGTAFSQIQTFLTAVISTLSLQTFHIMVIGAV
jgi:hypothetical protein